MKYNAGKMDALFEIKDLLTIIFKYVKHPPIFNRLSYKIYKEKSLKIGLDDRCIDEIKSLYSDRHVKHITFYMYFDNNTMNDALSYFKPQSLGIDSDTGYDWNELYNTINNSNIYKMTIWIKTCPALSLLKNITHVKIHGNTNKIYGSNYIKKIYNFDNELSDRDIIKFPNVEHIKVRCYDNNTFKKYNNTKIKKYHVECNTFISKNTSMYESMTIYSNDLHLPDIQTGVKYLTILPQYICNIDKRNYTLYEKHNNNINKIRHIVNTISIDIDNNIINDNSLLFHRLHDLYMKIRGINLELSHYTKNHIYNPFIFSNKREIHTPDLEELTVCTGTKYVFASPKLRKLTIVFALEKFSIDVIQSHIDYYSINNPTVVIKTKQKYPNIDEIIWCHNRGIVIKNNKLKKMNPF